MPDPVAWTEAPESARVLARQRNRWQRGLMDVLLRHKKMIFQSSLRLGRDAGHAVLLRRPVSFADRRSNQPHLLFVGLVAGLVDPGRCGSWGKRMVGAAITILTLFFDDLAFRSTPSSATDPADRVRHSGADCLPPMTIVWRLWGVRLFLMGRTEWGQQVRKGLYQLVGD
ncbi:MAG: glycosyltransferase family 2 protein [Acidimicrobiales bacterium]